MTEYEAADRNMVLGFEFDRYLVEHPEFAEQVPEEALVVLLPEKDAELCEFNRELAARQRRPGQVVFEVRIKELDPLPRSRIQSLSAVTIKA